MYKKSHWELRPPYLELKAKMLKLILSYMIAGLRQKEERHSLHSLARIIFWWNKTYRTAKELSLSSQLWNHWATPWPHSFTPDHLITHGWWDCHYQNPPWTEPASSFFFSLINCANLVANNSIPTAPVFNNFVFIPYLRKRLKSTNSISAVL